MAEYSKERLRAKICHITKVQLGMWGSFRKDFANISNCEVL